MKTYKLLTPGPLTTTDTVKQEMLFDHCTWDDDYKKITQEIRAGLLKLAHVSEQDYTAVLMQGSGTFGVESVLTSVTGPEDRLLICANGAYGERMADIAEHAGISYRLYSEHYNKVPDAQYIGRLLDEDPGITHVSMVHSETTSGILNDIESVGKMVKEKGRVFIVDAMSSFGGVDIPVKDWGIDFLVSSANKCIQGVLGFSFIIARRDLLMESAGKARSLSLDLYDQWKTMEADGKWRFTSPTHVVLAFARAMKELEEEGGIPFRNHRYTKNNCLLIEKMGEMGIRPYIDSEHQGPIITTFFYPEKCHFTFSQMYEYIKERGYAIYPGKVTEAETFRISRLWEEIHGTVPGEEEAQKLFSIFEDKLMSILHLYADPKPGVTEAVELLREKGIKIGSTTGYTDKMMEIVVPAAASKGYAPDVWFSPDSTGQKGRPYPYMIFRNMEALGLMDVCRVIKVGDTVSDIREGKNAGVLSAGIVTGSSEMGLSLEEFEALSPEEREEQCRRTEEKFLAAGADRVYRTLNELAESL